MFDINLMDEFDDLIDAIANSLSLMIGGMNVVGTERPHTSRISLCLVDVFALISHAMETGIRITTETNKDDPGEQGPMIKTHSLGTQTLALLFEALVSAIDTTARGVYSPDDAFAHALQMARDALTSYGGKNVAEMTYTGITPENVMRAVASVNGCLWSCDHDETGGYTRSEQDEKSIRRRCVYSMLNAAIVALMKADAMDDYTQARLFAIHEIACRVANVACSMHDALGDRIEMNEWWMIEEEKPFKQASCIIRESLVAISPSISHVAALLMHAADPSIVNTYMSYFQPLIEAVDQPIGEDVSHSMIFREVTSVIHKLSQSVQVIEEGLAGWPQIPASADGMVDVMELRNERAETLASIEKFLSIAREGGYYTLALAALSSRLVPWPKPNHYPGMPPSLFGEIDSSARVTSVTITGLNANHEEMIAAASGSRLFVSFKTSVDMVAINTVTGAVIDSSELDLDEIHRNSACILSEAEMQVLNDYGVVMLPVDMLASPLPSEMLIPEAVWYTTEPDWDEVECLDNIFSPSEMALLTRRVRCKEGLNEDLYAVPDSVADSDADTQVTTLGQCHANIVFCARVRLPNYQYSIALRDSVCADVVRSMESWLASHAVTCEYLPAEIDCETVAGLELFQRSIGSMTASPHDMIDTWNRGLLLLLEIGWGPYDSFTLLNAMCNISHNIMPGAADVAMITDLNPPVPITIEDPPTSEDDNQ